MRVVLINRINIKYPPSITVDDEYIVLSMYCPVNSDEGDDPIKGNILRVIENA